METQIATEAAFDTYKAVRKKFIEAGDSIFGPGFLSMAEYYFMRKKGYNPFAMLFSEPRSVYDEWVSTFKSEGAVERLFEKAVGPGYMPVLQDIRRNDGLRVWNALHRMANAGGRTAAA